MKNDGAIHIRRSPWAGFVLMVTAFYACFLFGARFTENSLTYLLLTVFCFSCVGILVWEFRKASFDPFSPVVFLSGFYLIEFVIRNAIYLHDGQLPMFYGDPIDQRKHLFALAVGLASYLVLLAGYYCPGIPRKVSGVLPSMLTRRTDVSPWAFLPVMLFSLGLGLLGWKFRFDYFGGFSNYLANLMQFKYVLISDFQESVSFGIWNVARDAMYLIVPLGYIFLFRGSGSLFLKGVWVICYVVLLILSILTGYRNMLLMVVMGVFLLHHYMVKPFSKRVILISFIGILLGVSVLTYLQSLLYVLTWGWEEQGGSYAITGVFKTAVTFDALWGVCSTFPDKVPYLKGATFLDMFTAFVPRLFWEAKKEIYGINEITMLMGMPTTFQTSVSMPGELLANFGIFGLAGMFLYGILFRAIDMKKNRDAGWAMGYAVFFSARWLAIFWMGFTGLATTVYTMIPFYFVLRVINILPGTTVKEDPSAGTRRGHYEP